MTNTLQEVLQLADELARDLQALRTRAHRAGMTDTEDRIERELTGWPANEAVPRYRHVVAEIRGELQGTRMERDALLPTGHLAGGGHAVIADGLLHLSESPALGEALRAGSDVVKRPLDAQSLPLFVRGLPPDSGVRIVAAWEWIPARSLVRMLQAIRAYLFAMRS